MKILPPCHRCLLPRTCIGVTQQVQGTMNQKSLSLLYEGYVIFPRLALRTVKIDVNFRLSTWFILLAKRECNDVRDVVMAEKPAVDPAHCATSNENDRQPK